MWLQPHRSSSYLNETITCLTADTELLVDSKIHPGNVLVGSGGTSVSIVESCNINHIHSADNGHDHLAITASILPTKASGQLCATEAAIHRAIEQNPNTLTTGHTITRPLSHPSPATLRIQKPVETSYSMSQSLNLSREDPWTSQYLRFQTQHTPAGQQQSYSLRQFLEGGGDDPWTPGCPSIRTPRVTERDLHEVDRLFGISTSGMCINIDSSCRTPSQGLDMDTCLDGDLGPRGAGATNTS